MKLHILNHKYVALFVILFYKLFAVSYSLYCFKKSEVVNELHWVHENFVLVPADKASNNIVFVKVTIILVF